MALKDRLRDFKNNNPYALYMWNEWRRRQGQRQQSGHSDYEFIVKEYKRTTGYDLNLANPKRFTEKLQWLKLFYRDDCIEECTDKYTARAYVEKAGHSELLNTLLGTYGSADEIDFEALPKKFVLKASHGSGWNIICKDKSQLNWKIYQKIINSWMKQNLYVYGREWNYQNLTPKIIIEKYIESTNGQLTDYKFFCFNGNVAFIQVDNDRFNDHKQSYFDPEWNLLPFATGHKTQQEPCPTQFKTMKQLAIELSRPFPHVRMDFYEVEGKIYFGEFTFFDGSGFYTYDPDEWDFTWGEKMTLPEANYNLELLKSLK